MEGGISMNTELFDEDKHISESTFIAFKEGSLSDNDLILVAEHICNCEKCNEVLSNSFAKNDLMEAPSGFEEEVKSKIKKRKKKIFNLFFTP